MIGAVVFLSVRCAVATVKMPLMKKASALHMAAAARCHGLRLPLMAALLLLL